MTAQTEERHVPRDTLANRLFLVRRELGLTHREAEVLTGVGRGSWQSWESGRSPRDEVRKLTRVADALHIDREWLMFGGPLRPEEAEPMPPAPIAARSTHIPAGLSAQHPNGGYETVENDITRLRKRIPLRQTSNVTSMWRVAA